MVALGVHHNHLLKMIFPEGRHRQLKKTRSACRPNMKVVSKESSLYLFCVTFPCHSIAAAHCTSVRGRLYVCRMSPSERKGKSDAPQSTKKENPIMKQQKSLSP